MMGFTEVFWVLIVFAIGMVAFVVIVLVGAARTLGRICGLLGRLLFGRPRRRAIAAPRRRLLRACPQAQCGFLNTVDARYCARCGTPLKTARIIEAHDG